MNCFYNNFAKKIKTLGDNEGGGEIARFEDTIRDELKVIIESLKEENRRISDTANGTISVSIARIKELESAMQDYIDGGYMDNIETITKFKQLLKQ